MYTSCPICETVFRVTEEQLQRAGGKVRCGQCHHVFNAQDHLHSEPPRADATAASDSGATTPPIPAESIAHTEPQAQEPPEDTATYDAPGPTTDAGDVIAELEQLDVDLSVPPARPEADEQGGEDFEFEWAEEDIEEITLEGPPPPAVEERDEFVGPVTSEDEIDIASAHATDSKRERAEQTEPTPDADAEPEPTISRAWTQAEGEFTAPAQDSEHHAPDSGEPPVPTVDEFPAGSSAVAGADRLAASSDDIPAVLRDALAEAQQAPRSTWKTVSAVALSALLVIALLAQLAFYNRSGLIQRYPALTPVAQQLCAQLGCEIELPRDVSHIVVVSRDVRSHPAVNGALLITATINNEAAFAQQYPDVELSLFDLTGTLVAQRRFAPEEYLDDAPQPGTAALMQPDKPVRLRLEVRDPGQHAINYEFTFL